jgi:hypothetical protein
MTRIRRSIFTLLSYRPLYFSTLPFDNSAPGRFQKDVMNDSNGRTLTIQSLIKNHADNVSGSFTTRGGFRLSSGKIATGPIVIHPKFVMSWVNPLDIHSCLLPKDLFLLARIMDPSPDLVLIGLGSLEHANAFRSRKNSQYLGSILGLFQSLRISCELMHTVSATCAIHTISYIC